MVTVGQQLTVIGGVVWQTTLNGNIYAKVRSGSVSVENKEAEYPTSGTDQQTVITEEYHAEADLTVLLSTENTSAKEQFIALATPGANGSIAPVNLVLQGSDTQGTVATRTYTWTGGVYPQKAKITWQGASAVLGELHLIINSRPVIA